MKCLCVILFSLLANLGLSAGITVKQALVTLQKQSIAANSGDVEALLKTVPKLGVKVHDLETNEARVDTRESMKKQLTDFYKGLDSSCYVYGVKVLSAHQKEDSVVLMLEVSQVYQMKGSDEFRSWTYQEEAMMKLEGGQVVIKSVAMKKLDGKSL
ncbi:hypothetical protein SAMN02745181_0064 [Rubritalea squalenifaciens DSM 18772]|uniref:Nuclear transport factor 2 family protein n=1 Tax=Rubritalea squalenifaciens DSM 18772 TaxID=1123071 RepID=A0A1M6AX82_9BACT|nr:hypothetical protein [Rubritalea squalenifaciens]SHI41096.1 hypothetical protein SAMN02745181_0064 [Rubritalea squalenifaciens DSM 18772]